MNLSQLEAAGLLAFAGVLSANETTILADLGPLDTEVENAIETFVKNALARVPIIGAIISAAFAADAAELQAAILGGEKSLIDHLIAFCNAEAAKLTAAK